MASTTVVEASSSGDGQGAPQSPTPLAVPNRSGWLTLIVVGSVVTMLGGSFIWGAAWLVGAAATQTENGFLETRGADLVASANAVTTAPAILETSLDRETFPQITVSVKVGTDDGAPVFVGIGPASDVAQYLDGVNTAELNGVVETGPTLQTRDIPGSLRPELPTAQPFWAASDSGAGIREFSWVIEPGEWTLVIMNADGSAGIDTVVSAGVQAPWAIPLAVGTVVISIGLLLVGIALIVVGVLGWGRGRTPATGPRVGHYPAALTGELREPLSRGLWLVKWILIIPHWIVLGILWVAFVVSTVAAGFAILFTGKYPRAIFDFNVGVLRWSWRVSFYSYSALGTDQYPPFSLERAEYPAGFDVEYPERLSHWLVFVKSWLLALPHLVIVGVLTGGTVWGVGWMRGSTDWAGAGVSLLAILVLVAAVILLFAGRYQQPLFDFIMGINRWAYRVTTYVALMRDEYPPFRLDVGASEPVVTQRTAQNEVQGG